MANPATFFRFGSVVGTALILLASCTRHFEPITPAGFVELNDQKEYAYRATNPDGVVIAVREIKHDPKGALAFWERAVENELREGRGYALLGKEAARTRSGLVGTTLRFGHDEGRNTHLYSITVFVTGDHVFLIEVGGPKNVVEGKAGAIRAAIASFEPEEGIIHSLFGWL